MLLSERNSKYITKKLLPPLRGYCTYLNSIQIHVLSRGSFTLPFCLLKLLWIDYCRLYHALKNPREQSYNIFKLFGLYNNYND